MAPQAPYGEHSVNRTPEYEQFIQDLRAFHEARGTTRTFDPEPKMGSTTVDLLRLYRHIIDAGGYDKVSEEKLMWRTMCQELGLMRHNAPADAYALKNLFYKNLAAYEIKTLHKQEPPPPEILEHVTAKGGSLLSRTVENFAVTTTKPKTSEQRTDSGDDGTPVGDIKPSDTPSSAPNSVRASRGLREAPPPRVIFHPDTSSSRQTRHASNPNSSSSSVNNYQLPSGSSQGPNGFGNMGTPIPAHLQQHSQRLHSPTHVSRAGTSFEFVPTASDAANPSVASYQFTAPHSLPVRVVDTPASNADLFAKRIRLLQSPAAHAAPPVASLMRQLLHSGATNIDGPNIYERCLLCLRSGARAEQAFALNHLVKISYERGDKYKFSQFPGLIEGLVDFALKVGSLFYHVDWEVSWDPGMDEFTGGQLDGNNGTPDIMERISSLLPKHILDSIQPAEFTDLFGLVTEAVLTIRNMSMLQDNAGLMSDFPPLKDLLCILLNLPTLDLTVEIKHSALDIAEQITPNLVLDTVHDPLYQSLLAQLVRSNDRGVILTALRAVGRISMNHQTETNKLPDVPPQLLRRITDWILLNDDELLDACLDFLYQYTAVVANLNLLLKTINGEHLVMHLVRLLSHGVKRVHREIVVSEAKVVYDPPNERVVPTPKDLLERLLKMEEPERCYTWMRCFFEDDPESQITQIAIWQAYNTAFLEPLKQENRSMINAADFIRSINVVYKNAGAQIVHDQGPSGAVQRFVIKGIRPRPYPVSPEGHMYFQCQWRGPSARSCGTWSLDARDMWIHVLTDHLHKNLADGVKAKNEDEMFTCKWAGCAKYSQPTWLPLYDLIAHVKAHLVLASKSRGQVEARGNGLDRLRAVPHSAMPPAGTPSGARPRVVQPAKTLSLTYEETASVRDERHPQAPPAAGGIPVSALLILRNVARNSPKTKASEEEEAGEERQAQLGGGGGSGELVNSNVQFRSPWNPNFKIAMRGCNERLFRNVITRLCEVLADNKLLSPYIISLFQVLSH